MFFFPVLVLCLIFDLTASNPLAIAPIQPPTIESRALSPNNILLTIGNDIQIAQTAFFKTNRVIESLASGQPTGPNEYGTSYEVQCKVLNKNMMQLINAAEQAKWGVAGDLADCSVPVYDAEVDVVAGNVDTTVALAQAVMRMFQMLAMRRPDLSQDVVQNKTETAVLFHLKGIFYPLAEFSGRIIGSQSFGQDNGSIRKLFEAKETGMEYFGKI